MPTGPGDWDWFAALAGALRSGGPVALATVIDGPHTGAKRLVRPDGDHLGSLGDPDLDGAVTRDTLGALSAGRTEIRHYGPGGQIGRDDVTVFIESHAPPPRMLIFGAVDFTAALARVGAILGFRVTVCDARQTFATDARFPMADEVVVDWPHRLLEQTGSTLGPDDAVCVLTHDSKFDVPAIIAALATDVGYIGVLGSRRTHEDRVRRLEAEGVDDDGLARIMAPIGLDIGGSTPEETAVSIGAEIIACRSGRQVPSLRDGSGPIHSTSPPG